MSRSLSAAQFDGLSAYYAGQRPQREPLEGAAPRIAAGQTVFEAGVPAKNIFRLQHLQRRRGPG